MRKAYFVIVGIHNNLSTDFGSGQLQVSEFPNMRVAACIAIAGLFSGPAVAGPPTYGESSADTVSVLTYHNDAQRTGWNPLERTLTPSTVSGGSFDHLATQQELDGQVDVQPLVVANQQMEGRARTVVYVATESNTVYGLDGASGDILIHRNLGAPVPRPLGCDNNAPAVGINGTPVIDLQARTLYLIAYELQADQPTYELHALDLETLVERPTFPIVLKAQSVLINGGNYAFDPMYQRQRPALLDANGNIYAAFGSFCDFKALYSRGWILAWNKAAINEPTGFLSNRLPPATTTSDCTYHGNRPCFLSSIWMSGYGPSSDSQGRLYVITGNSARGTFDSTSNISESVARFSKALTLEQVFTPSDSEDLDASDRDFGSGGVLVVPDLTPPFEHLAIAAGKDGRMYVLNRDQIHSGAQYVDIGECFCGPSFFVSDKGPRIVSSGGLTVELWEPTTAELSGQLVPTLQRVAQASDISPGQGYNPKDGTAPGFFTSVSSDGTKVGSAIIWALGRPAGLRGADHQITLYAFDGTPKNGLLPLLWSHEAGIWGLKSLGGFANLVPTIANGHVYVASGSQLQIFGLKTQTPPTQLQAQTEAVTSSVVSPSLRARSSQERADSGTRVWGTIISTSSHQLVIELSNGRRIRIDATAAIANHTAKIPAVGQSISVAGKMDAKSGVLKARVVNEAKSDQQSWGIDVIQ